MKPKKIKLTQCNLFTTPSSFKDIEKWIELHPPEEKVHLYTVAYMVNNLLAEWQKEGKL